MWSELWIQNTEVAPLHVPFESLMAVKYVKSIRFLASALKQNQTRIVVHTVGSVRTTVNIALMYYTFSPFFKSVFITELHV